MPSTNAVAESFFATLECELLDRPGFKRRAQARLGVFEFIEGFYNPRRRHPEPGSPERFEANQSRWRKIEKGRLPSNPRCQVDAG